MSIVSFIIIDPVDENRGGKPVTLDTGQNIGKVPENVPCTAKNGGSTAFCGEKGVVIPPHPFTPVFHEFIQLFSHFSMKGVSCF